MTASAATESIASVPTTIETRQSWTVCLTALGIAIVAFAAPTITVVGLKSIAADLGGQRSVPALVYSLAWLGASFGGIPMGRAAERFGIRFTITFGSAMIAVGLAIAQSGGRFGLLVGYGLFVGLLAILASTLRSISTCRAGLTDAAVRRGRLLRRCLRGWASPFNIAHLIVMSTLVWRQRTSALAEFEDQEGS